MKRGAIHFLGLMINYALSCFGGITAIRLHNVIAPAIMLAAKNEEANGFGSSVLNTIKTVLLLQ